MYRTTKIKSKPFFRANIIHFPFQRCTTFALHGTTFLKKYHCWNGWHFTSPWRANDILIKTGLKIKQYHCQFDWIPMMNQTNLSLFLFVTGAPHWLSFTALGGLPMIFAFHLCQQFIWALIIIWILFRLNEWRIERTPSNVILLLWMVDLCDRQWHIFTQCTICIVCKCILTMPFIAFTAIYCAFLSLDKIDSASFIALHPIPSYVIQTNHISWSIIFWGKPRGRPPTTVNYNYRKS